MPIVVSCRSCGHQLQAPEQLAGRAARCPACLAVVQVPLASPPAGDPLVAAPQPNQASGPPPPWSQPSIWMPLVVGGGLCLFLMAAALLMSGLRKPRHADPIVVAGADAPAEQPAVQQEPAPTSAGEPSRPLDAAPVERRPTIIGPSGRPDEPDDLDDGTAGVQAGDSRRMTPVSPKNPGAVTIARWHVEADPPAVPVRFSQEADIRLGVPGKVGTGAVLYPYVPSPIVAVGNITAGREAWDVWDLSSMTKLAGLKGRFPSTTVAISPDGAYIAAYGGFGFDRKILVWDVKRNKALGQLDGRPSREVLAFSSPDRLVSGVHDDRLILWHLPSGQEERELPLPPFHNGKSLAFSPGGRYLTVVDGERLRLYELDSGETAGEMVLPDSFDTRGIAFSPDGTQLAGLFDSREDQTLIAWDMESGDAVETIHVGPRGAGREYTGRALEWFPDCNRWLVLGRTIVDRRLGRAVWRLPNSESTTPAAPRVVLDDERLMVIAGPPEARVLTGYQLPREEIAAAARAVESGGELAVTGMPPLKPADWSTARKVALDAASKWQVSADPLPSAEALLPAQPLRLKTEDGVLKSVRLARPDAAQALVMNAARVQTRPSGTDSLFPPDGPDWPPEAEDFFSGLPPELAARLPPELAARIGGGRRPAGVETEVPFWLDRYDLRTGERQASVNIPFRCELVSFSPDASHALLRSIEDEDFFDRPDRVDVLRLADASYIAGWRPYDHEAAEHQEVTWAAFVNADHVLTMNHQKKLVLWKLPECQAVYVMEGAGQPALTPNHKYLAVYADKAYRFFDALTGDARGELAFDSPPAAAAFHPAGRRLALAASAGLGSRITCLELASGKVEHELVLPSRPRSMHWCGNDHLLIDNAALVDLGLGAVVWSYHLSRGLHVADSPDGRHWFAAALPSGPRGLHLRAARLPEPGLASKLAGARFCVQPGATLSLAITLPVVPGKPNLADQVRRNVTEQLAKKGIHVADRAPVVLELTMTHARTGQTLEYDVHGLSLEGRGGKVRVEGQKITCAMVVADGGKPVWKAEAVVTNDITFSNLNEGESVEAHLNRMMWEAAAGYLLNLLPPTRVLAGATAAGLDRSDLAALAP
ncbi:MAG: hypothetical protein WD847_10010 [Pirellulales bacterium]